MSCIGTFLLHLLSPCRCALSFLSKWTMTSFTLCQQYRFTANPDRFIYRRQQSPPATCSWWSQISFPSPRSYYKLLLFPERSPPRPENTVHQGDKSTFDLTLVASVPLRSVLVHAKEVWKRWKTCLGLFWNTYTNVLYTHVVYRYSCTGVVTFTPAHINKQTNALKLMLDIMYNRA